MCVNVVRQLFVWMIFFGLISCSSESGPPLGINFSRDSSSIVFSAIEPAGLYALRNSNDTSRTYASIVSVVEEPENQDLPVMEHALGGNIITTDSTMVFRPDVPFVKGRTYRVTTYLNAKFGNLPLLVKRKVRAGLKPQTMRLRR